MHSFGIAHRDMKLENIMMTDSSDKAVLKIVDFGLAKLLGPHEKATDSFGTITYAAPEILLQQPYGKGVDLWGLGVITHVLLCGYLPFDDCDDSEIAKKVLYKKV